VGTRSTAEVKEALERMEAQEGIGRSARLTADRTQRTLRESKALKSSFELGRPQGSPARGNGMKARSRRRAVTASGEGKTLKGKAWTCQRDETSPQGVSGSKPPRGCENLRADGGGGLETIATADLGH